MENAIKEQLIQIIFNEDCDLDTKYEALFELQMREVPEWKIKNKVREFLYELNKTIREAA